MTFPFGFDDLEYINSTLTDAALDGNDGGGNNTTGNTGSGGSGINNSNTGASDQITDNCPPPNEFLGCTGIPGVGLFSTGADASGNCTSRTGTAVLECPPTTTPTPSTSTINTNTCAAIGENCNGIPCCAGGTADFNEQGICSCVPAQTNRPTPTPTATQITDVCPSAGTFIGCSGTGNIGIFSLGTQPDGGCLNEERVTSRCIEPPPTPTQTNTVTYNCCFQDVTNPGTCAGTCNTSTVPCDYLQNSIPCSNDGCAPGYIGQAYCSGKNIIRDYQLANCNIEPRNITTCEFSCENGNCKTDPPPPPPDVCDKQEEENTCAYVFQDSTYSGIATRLVGIPNSPPGCTLPAPSGWNTSGCTRIGDPPICFTEEQSIACNQLPGLGNNTGTARRTVVKKVNGQPEPSGCVATLPENPAWDTSACTQTPPDDTPRECRTGLPIDPSTLNNYNLSSEPSGVACYVRKPSYRLCGTPANQLILGTPGPDLEQSNDTVGACYTPRPSYRRCGQQQTTAGTPGPELQLATDNLGSCYESRPRWRACDTQQFTYGTPPTGYTQQNDTYSGQLGACWVPAATWRYCEQTQQNQGTPPANLIQSTDNIGTGVCYTTYYIFCANPSNRIPGGRPDSDEYEFDPNNSCWKVKEPPPPPPVKTCTCYTVSGNSGVVEYVACTDETETYTTSQLTGQPIGICVNNLYGIRTTSGVTAQSTGTDCTNNQNLCIITPPPPPRTYRVCGSTALLSGNPPTGYITSIDQYEGVCYEKLTDLPKTYRICGNSAMLAGDPPREYVPATDQYGICFKEPPVPPSYRICGNANTITGDPPLNYIQSTDQYFGVCYTPEPEWRSCVTGELVKGVPPVGHRQTVFNGPGGGTCWEPSSIVGFEPNLGSAYNFLYKRGSGDYPTAIKTKAINPSYATSYKVTLTTNNKIKLNEGDGSLTFILTPRGTYDFTLNISPELYTQLGDGKSTLSLEVEITEI